MKMDTTNARYIKEIRNKIIRNAILTIKQTANSMTDRYRYNQDEYAKAEIIRENIDTINEELDEAKNNFDFLIQEIENLQGEVEVLTRENQNLKAKINDLTVGQKND